MGSTALRTPSFLACGLQNSESMNVCRFKLPRSCVAWLQQPQETDPGPSTSQGSPRARHHPGHRASQQLAALAGEQRRDLHHLTPKPRLYSRSLCDSHRNPRQRTASLRIRGPSPSRPAGGSPLEAEPRTPPWEAAVSAGWGTPPAPSPA